MKELKIYEYQAKDIYNALRLAARTLESKSKETSMDRDIIQSLGFIENVLNEDIDKEVLRF